MRPNKIAHENGQQQLIPSFRSVGCIPYDFHRLKYTTSYRNFGRKIVPSEPHNEPGQLKLNLQLQLTERREEFPMKVKKDPGLVDKWKQKYKRIEQDHYFERRKSYDHLPNIRRQLIDINQRLRITKYASPPKKQKEFPHLSNKKIPNPKSESPVSRKLVYDQTHKSSSELRKEYALSLNHKPILQVNHKKTQSNLVGLLRLKQVEQMPARWETFEEQDWMASNHQA